MQRNIVFNYFAALTKKLRAEKLSKVLSVIMLPLLRELSTTDEQGLEIRRVAKEVISYYRPLERYDEAVTEVQRILDIKRAKRKSQKAHMVSFELISISYRKYFENLTGWMVESEISLVLPSLSAPYSSLVHGHYFSLEA